MMARLSFPGSHADQRSNSCLRHSMSPVYRAAFEALEQRRLLSGDGELVVCPCPNCSGIGSFIDPNDAVQVASITGGRASGDALPGLPILNSLPSAPAAIYLDFNGYGSYRAYSVDSDYTTFNAQEAANITGAWHRVSMYFAMFNVNVTTQFPTVPFAWQLTSPDTGGVSYVNVFPNSSTGGPRSFNNSSGVTGRTSAFAHEVGHNFGLQHQSFYNDLGVRNETGYTAGYDAQHGFIMGSDWAHVVRKWVLAHNSTSTGGWTLQDEIAIIAGDLDNYGGDGFRPDDHGATIGAATVLTPSGVDQVAQGVIERLNDVDMFQFTSTGGRYLVGVGRENESGVDIKLEIYNSSGQLLASEDWRKKNDADIAIDLPAGTYYARVASHGNYGDLGMYNIQVSPIAAGFDSMDVILSRRAGTTSWNPTTGQWTIVAGGRPEPSPTSDDDTTTFDQFRYAYTPLAGDGEIIARVTSDAANSGAFAGLMIRESLADDARFAMVNVSPGNNVRFTRRITVGASHLATTTGGVTGDYWLKLVRSGNSFTAFRSANGTTWTQVGSAQTIAMGADAYVGFAAMSRVEQETITATFNNVTLIGNTGDKVYPSNGLAAPANVVVSRAVGSDLGVSWNAVAGATGYVVERSVDGVNFSLAGTTAAGVLSLNDPGLEGSARYYYRVFATNSVAGARSTASLVVNQINRPSAVWGVKTMSILENRIVIDWIDTDGETGYRIERSSNGGTTWSTIGSVGMNVPSYTDNSVTSATTYQYRIVPLSSFGDGVTSNVVIESSRLPAITPDVIVTSNSVTLNWTDLNLGETGYQVFRSTTNGTWSWTSVGTLGADATTFTQTGLSSLTRYYYRVQAITPLTESAYNNVPVATLGTSTTPLAPWQTADIGDTVDSGSTVSLSGSTYTMIANGSDVGTTSDDLHFMYQEFTGDVSITVRVASLDGPDGAEVGLMFRTSLADNSPYAMAIITNDADSRFNRRSTVGGSTSSTNGGNMANGNNVVAPYWLRLSRTNNSVRAEQSPDGTTWTTIGTVTLSLGTTIFAGLAVSSQHATTMARATFTNLTVTGAVVGPVDTTPPDAPVFGGITVDGGASSSDLITFDSTLVFNGTAEPGSTVTFKREGNTIGTAITNGTGNWTFDYTSVILPNGVHTIVATATDAAGNVSTESSITVTIDTIAPTADFIRFEYATGHNWEIGFSEDVSPSLAPTDFAILNTSTGQTLTPTIVSWNAETKMLTLGLAGNAKLADGTYFLQLRASSISDIAGNVFGARSQSFKVLTGDANGDGVVDFSDLLALAQNYGTSGKNFKQGNFNYDGEGKVDFDDLLLLAQKYGGSAVIEAIAGPQKPVATTEKTATAASKRKPDGLFSSLSIA